MALKDFLSLADDKLHEVFAKKEHDPRKDRAAMIKRLDTAHGQFQSETPVKGRKMFRLANGVVELTLPFEIGGKSVFHIPTERFSDAIQHLKDAVGKGEADEHLKSGAATGGGVAAPRAPRKAKDAEAPRYSEGSRGWSDERRAKCAATVAARNAAKGE